MATYKKRGYKTKPKQVEEVINDEELSYQEGESTTEEVFNTLDDTANKTEEWVAENQKYIFGSVGAIALVVLLYLGYQNLVVFPKEEKAASELFVAQQTYKDALEANSIDKQALYNKALSGVDGESLGFLDVIADYSGTDAANVANYYAGFAYLSLEKYDEAIKYLDTFSSDDYVLNALAKGGIGDAFAQLDQGEQALDYYKKALAEKPNSFTTPKFLLKSAKIALELGKVDVAINSLEKINKEYSETTEADEVEGLLAKAKASK